MTVNMKITVSQDVTLYRLTKRYLSTQLPSYPVTEKYQQNQSSYDTNKYEHSNIPEDSHLKVTVFVTFQILGYKS
jgi:hypothetical protein